MHLIICIRQAKLGLSHDIGIAGKTTPKFGVNVSTINRWLKSYPEILESYNKKWQEAKQVR
jgi:hypothetical protein